MTALGVDDISTVIDAAELWLKQRDYAGIDPYDALGGRRVPAVVKGRKVLRQGVLQAAKRSPIDVRPALGVAPRRIGKALGLIATGYAELHAAGWGGLAHEPALELLAWLGEARVPKNDARAWGYEFDVQTRWAFYPAGTPNLIATTFIGNAFLDWHEQLGKEEHLSIALEGARYLRDRLLVDRAGDRHFAYVPGVRSLIHNANALGSAFVARAGRASGDRGLIDLGRETSEATLRDQDAAGLWPYGEGRNLRWVDGFHTAYTLDGLYTLWQVSGDDRLLDRVRQGLAAYIERLFVNGVLPRYSTGSIYPVDIHCASSAIDLLTRLRSVDERCRSLAEAVMSWTIANMWDPEGFFHYQKTRWYTNRIPYIRWSQAHMFKAMARMLAAMAEQ